MSSKTQQIIEQESHEKTQVHDESRDRRARYRWGEGAIPSLFEAVNRQLLSVQSRPKARPRETMDRSSTGIPL